MKKIALLCPAVNVFDYEIVQWTKIINGYESQYNIVPFLITEKDVNFKVIPGRFFSKAKCLNWAISKFINSADIIIQTDIDCLFPSELLDRTLQLCNDDNFVFCKCRRIPKDFHGNWEEYKNVKISHGEGGWNAASPNIWKKLGGYNDTICGRGGEDIDLHWRIREIYNIPMEIIEDVPLVHVSHPHRKWNDGHQEKLNHQKLYARWKEWKQNPTTTPNWLNKYLEK